MSLFVNGVEWPGRPLKFGETATAPSLAASGTALPESAVTFVAAMFGATAAQKEIGVGAAIGGPLVLSTISCAVVGIVFASSARRLHRRDGILPADRRRLSRDRGCFLGIFARRIVPGLVVFEGKRRPGLCFLAAYAVHACKEMTHQGELGAECLEPLRFGPHAGRPMPGVIPLQKPGPWPSSASLRMFSSARWR